MGFESKTIKYVTNKIFTRSEAKNKWKWKPSRYTTTKNIILICLLTLEHYSPSEMTELLADKMNLTLRERTFIRPGKKSKCLSNTVWYLDVSKFMNSLLVAGILQRDDKGRYYMALERVRVVNRETRFPEIRYFKPKDIQKAKTRDAIRPRLGRTS